MLHRTVRIFIHDILIYWDTLNDHVKHVQAVLQTMYTAFLGYVISSEGVAMVEGKVHAVLELPQPTYHP